MICKDCWEFIESQNANVGWCQFVGIKRRGNGAACRLMERIKELEAETTRLKKERESLLIAGAGN
jgi:pyrimidine operon attenuation protein/uracil phosphoribosyltransferase